MLLQLIVTTSIVRSHLPLTKFQVIILKLRVITWVYNYFEKIYIGYITL